MDESKERSHFSDDYWLRFIDTLIELYKRVSTENQDLKLKLGDKKEDCRMLDAQLADSRVKLAKAGDRIGELESLLADRPPRRWI